MSCKSDMEKVIAAVKEYFGADNKVYKLFEKCYVNTYETTLQQLDDGTVFIITGDIPAMWLRDSVCQVRHYLPLTKTSTDMADIIEKLINRQFKYINIDPYANAFNESENGRGHQDDDTEMSKWVWERKYEIDSLCYPVALSYLFWKQSGRVSHFNDEFVRGVNNIINLWVRECNHEENSSYSFQRSDCVPSDTLTRGGKGSITKPCGMTWSGFRPSDDACKYGYLVPANMFAVVALSYIEEIAGTVLKNDELKKRASDLRIQIKNAIEAHAVTEHDKYGKIYSYETDGMGNHNFMDDANVPSLLSIPYLGYTEATDPVYQNTRKFILSSENPYYYEGKYAKGIGSPHTPPRYIWHISLSMQGLTSIDNDEKKMLLDMIASTDAETGYMHEGFSVDGPEKFTRPWFAWANSIFSEFVLDYMNNKL